ncbi:hypothetical protein QE361_001238 [Sphingomonas sp. SORGH_AS802]|nr:hypothetical protein [Sphingomonas sp. SORGH_AS_0438]MDR6134263.1 hypothetical protein [Sphingomonas sp. SORGH_AS_0802]
MMRFSTHLSISRKSKLCPGSIIVMAPGAHVVIPSEADMVRSTTWSKTHGAQGIPAATRRAMPAHPAKAAPRGWVADRQTRVHGHALDLTAGGPDADDAAFGKAA